MSPVRSVNDIDEIAATESLGQGLTTLEAQSAVCLYPTPGHLAPAGPANPGKTLPLLPHVPSPSPAAAAPTDCDEQLLECGARYVTSPHLELHQPFYNNIYYAYPPDTQGTHSSAGIPSLLNSPQSQPSSGSQTGPRPASAMSGPSTSTPVTMTIAPFKFRARRESVDWRRIGAVDVDRVAAELDFHTLQEHITAVTFCSVEGERCPRCNSAADPALLKLFRLAQLTVEYLLHSQDCLALSLQASEERIQVEVREKEQLQAQLLKQGQEVKTLKEELKQRKKIIASQQAMISAGMANYHKCQHCDKAFMNSSFLQSHMQRRHPEEYDIKLMTDNQKKLQSMKFQEEINKLKEQLTLTRSQLETQQQVYMNKLSQEKDLGQKQEEFMKQLEIWKEDERVRLNRQMDDFRESCHQEADSLHKRNLNLEKQLSKVQEANRKLEERILAMQDGTAKVTETQHQQEVIKLQQKFQKQEEKWVTKMQKVKEEHEVEKNQLRNEMSQLRSSFLEEMDEARRQVKDLDLKLKEQGEIIASQNSQMKHISLNPPTIVVQREGRPTPVPAAPEPKPQMVVCEQSSSVHKLDPIVELSEEERDSSSVSEKQTKVRQQELEQLMKKPGLRRDMRQVVQQNLQDKLLSLGVQPGVNGLAKGTYKTAMAKVLSARRTVAREIPEYTRVQEDLRLQLEQRVKEKSAEPASKTKQSSQVVQARPRSSSLPSRVTRVASGPAPKQHLTPQPAPRSKTGTLAKAATPKTPPFSSDEDSEEEEEEEEDESDEEELPQRHKAPQSKLPQTKTTKVKSQPATPPRHTVPQATSTPHATRQHHPTAHRTSTARHTTTQRPPAPQPASPAGAAVRTAVVAVESDGEWTEGSEMEELQQLRKHRDLNGNVERNVHDTVVKNLTRSLEKQLEERGPKKPAGGVNTVPIKKDAVKELRHSGMNENDDDDDDDDDWDISSLEDVPAIPKPSQSPGPVKKSLDKSLDTSTSVWGSSTGKGQKPGLTEAGTGSTLKSSLVSVSDWSDSDEI
ncbi:cilium assembly protein DZIP1 [Chanos chanos]|uniref:Cilium assembly protein DZIP1 n=1 Tax=Chanos chanos TaxID=29144 RepID=A0A6J2W0B3_CHACN|nr:zinc finger protein DZIP1 [Chanos chanos]